MKQLTFLDLCSGDVFPGIKIIRSFYLKYLRDIA